MPMRQAERSGASDAATWHAGVTNFPSDSDETAHLGPLPATTRPCGNTPQRAPVGPAVMPRSPGPPRRLRAPSTRRG